MKPAIAVHNLSKQYRIGVAQDKDNNLTETLRTTARNAWDKLARLLHPRRDIHEDHSFWALKDVSFEVKPGEVVGIIGRNGAGKSTLLKVLSQIVEPTSGHAIVRGRMGSLLEVGTGFHPELTGRENIYLNGAILGMKREVINAKFDEIVAFAEVEKFLDTPVKRYSSGMYVRLAFSVAAHFEPEILIVDEVLAVGDAAFQRKCLDQLRKVSGAGRTVLFVSHNLAAVAQLCKHVVWLSEGKLKEKGPSSTIITNYLMAESTQLPSREWSLPDAPGDNRVRLLSAKIVQDDQVTGVVDINKSCSIMLRFCAMQDIENLVTGINLYDAGGQCLLAHCDWTENSLQKGVYSKFVTIPQCLLAEGIVNVLIQLVFYDPDIKSLVLRDALMFEAIDSHSPKSIRGPYKGTWPGALRPALHWSDVSKQPG